ncbi:recombinase family protein [Pseudomonas putida]|jgi:DNA invertase Pin-like site-specific DNA recombinase|nr:recombinase family protein [Pseudomonas putida]
MNQRVGYACVSTDDRSLDLQRAALHLSGVQSIYEEKASGKAASRSELNHCLTALRAGDTLVVWRLDRLGRSLPDLVRIVVELDGKGIGFESITEKIETASAAGRLMFHVFAALAEFERNLIRERTQVGLAAARARGRSGGRKPKLDAQQIREIRRLMADPNIPVSQIAERYKVSRTTLYKVAPRGSASTGSVKAEASVTTPRVSV